MRYEEQSNHRYLARAHLPCQGQDRSRRVDDHVRQLCEEQSIIFINGYADVGVKMLTSPSLSSMSGIAPHSSTTKPRESDSWTSSMTRMTYAI